MYHSEFKYEDFDHPNWKYVLTEDLTIMLDNSTFGLMFGGIDQPYFRLTHSGMLTIKKGYTWDGLSSFPDRKQWLMGSAVHDTLIQMCDEGFIPDAERNECHREMRIILEHTSNKFWAYVIYAGLVMFHPLYRRLK